MYVPKAFELSESESFARLTSRAFGVFVTPGAEGLEASHLPFMARRDPLRLLGHLARANPQARTRAGTGLLIWWGPDAYVSPSHYPSKARHGRVVPTWNYEAVHAEGEVRWFDDPSALHELLAAETEGFERSRSRPWTLDDAPPDYVEGMVRGVVGFEMMVRSLKGASKLSQNRDAEDREGVRAGLSRSRDRLDRRVGEAMEE
jgi:transcriptional regulator